MLSIDKFLQFIALAGKHGLLLVGLLLTLTLSGCVQYETTIRFQRFNAGELVQHVRIEPQLYQLDKPAVDRWISSIEQRTQALGGQLQHPSPLDLTATLPFHTAQELTEKFAAFFSSKKNGDSISPQLELQENNFLLASRYRLNYDVDLSSLTNNLALASNKSSGLAFVLALQVPSRPWSLSQKWQLPIGQPHHTQATFWLLNPLGIGGVLIIGLVIVAYRLQSRLTATRP
jgi:CHASE1-domain containing sensor protein